MVVADLFYFVLAVFLVRPCMQPRAVVPSGWCAVTRDYDLIRRVGGGRVGVGSRLGSLTRSPAGRGAAGPLYILPMPEATAMAIGAATTDGEWARRAAPGAPLLYRVVAAAARRLRTGRGALEPLVTAMATATWRDGGGGTATAGRRGRPRRRCRCRDVCALEGGPPGTERREDRKRQRATFSETGWTWNCFPNVLFGAMSFSV